MKTKLILALCCIALLSMGCMAKGKKAKTAEKPLCEEWLMPDSATYKILGKNLSTILFSPNSVKCYSVKWQDSISADQLEPYFAQDSLISKLTKEQIAVLQYTLLDDADNFVNDSIVVMSPYVPKLDFEFTRKNQIAHVLVSPNSIQWTIVYDDKKQFTYNFHNPSFCKFVNQFYTGIKR